VWFLKLQSATRDRQSSIVAPTRYREVVLTSWPHRAQPIITNMPHQFAPGDDLIFQVESGLGLLRILAIEGEGAETVWHLLAYEEFFPSVEAAEAALANSGELTVRNAHMALTDRAFERTPAARLGNRALTEEELSAYRQWEKSETRKVSDRSALLQLGIR
jgi:hypothetical protein